MHEAELKPSLRISPQNRDELLQYILTSGVSPERAEDIAQEAMLSSLRTPQPNIRAALVRSARILIRRELTQLKARSADNTSVEAITDEESDIGPEDLITLRNLLAQLSDEPKRRIILRLVDGDGIDEVADAEQVSRFQVKTLRLILKKIFSAEDELSRASNIRNLIKAAPIERLTREYSAAEYKSRQVANVRQEVYKILSYSLEIDDPTTKTLLLACIRTWLKDNDQSISSDLKQFFRLIIQNDLHYPTGDIGLNHAQRIVCQKMAVHIIGGFLRKLAVDSLEVRGYLSGKTEQVLEERWQKYQAGRLPDNGRQGIKT